MTSSMKDAFKGEGGGLQNLSQMLGETVAGETNPQTSKQKGATEASSSLNDLANRKGGGATIASTSVSGADQVKNMHTGTADHLDMNLRKS
ncbi:hypothetical protein LTR82_009508 [Friedmanniomyces endolithicus]|uniref:SMP domain-containing protein n=1 Tax=Friedmanniomyces endolithicus TaxID=329885 RepID=A0AAN6FJA3_9PEZI|nr:hypothetical protein LTR82_009508 [Friedmanniomyces endolithicus]